MGTKNVKLNFKFNKTDCGFVLKREATVRECRHILKNILCIELECAEDFDYREDYTDYNKELKETVNKWLVGDADDSIIMEYAYDCSDDDMGIWNAFKIAEYLQQREII